MKKFAGYFWKLSISIEQFLNVSLGPIFNWILPVNPEHLFGNSDRGKVCNWLCRIFNIFDKNHCVESVEWGE